MRNTITKQNTRGNGSSIFRLIGFWLLGNNFERNFFRGPITTAKNQFRKKIIEFHLKYFFKINDAIKEETVAKEIKLEAKVTELEAKIFRLEGLVEVIVYIPSFFNQLKCNLFQIIVEEFD